MHLVKAGRKVFNLHYMVMSEEVGREGDGALVVTMATGREVALAGGDAEAFRSGLDDAMPPPAGSSAPGVGEPGGSAVPFVPWRRPDGGDVAAAQGPPPGE